MQSYFLSFSHFMVEMEKNQRKTSWPKVKNPLYAWRHNFLFFNFLIFYLVYLFKWFASLLIPDLFKMANVADDGYCNSTQ